MNNLKMENRNNSLIGLISKINSGKDVVGQIIQYLTSEVGIKGTKTFLESQGKTLPDGYGYSNFTQYNSPYEIKKYADKLKDIVCLIIGCTRSELEDRVFKEKELGEEWRVYKYDGKIYSSKEEVKEILLKQRFVNEIFDLEESYDYYVTTYVLTPRLLTQLIGTDCFRDKIHKNSWVNATFANYKPYEYEALKFVDGTYVHKCTECGVNFMGDKIQHECKDCVDKLNNEVVYPSWVISDVRFPNECEAIKKRNGILIKIDRPFKFRFPEINEKFLQSGHDDIKEYLKETDFEMYKKLYHESETALDDYTDYDYNIVNDGTIEDLVEKVREILIKEKVI
jgi:hypothetical protein